jgi:TolB-like protein/Flp pilus assembly protein TadD
MALNDPNPVYRFGDFELDLAAYELRRNGRSVRLERRPMDLLILLVKKHRRLVSRDEIVSQLWGKSVFVDVETSVNTAVRKVRQALSDSPEAPVYLETVSGKGYRFIAEVANGSPAAKRVTIAVLPFENLGGDSEREYLADGLTEEAIAAVGQIEPEHLTVIGRTSVLSYKRTQKTLTQIGTELNAAYLVEGSVRAETGRLRVTARLVRVSDQAQMWSSSYDSEPTSVLTFQRELSTAIAEQIRLRLSPERITALARRQTHNPAAYDLYLRGRHFWNQLTPPTTRRAMEYFRQAVELDPHYALAWSGLADAYSSSPITGDACPLEVWPRAKEAAANAVAAEPELAEAQTAHGFMNLFLGWDWPAAETAFRKAITLDWNYPLAHRMLGVLLAHMGRYEEASPVLRRARELDPLYAMHHALSAQAAFMGRDFDAALRFSKQAIVVNPEFWIGHLQLGQVLGQLGQTDAALDSLNAAARLSGGNSKALSYRGYLLATSGREKEARQVISTLRSIADERYLAPCAVALVHAGLRDVDQAFEWLDRSFQARDVHLVFLPVDVRWDSFRSDERFGNLMRRCGFAA